MSAHVLLNLLNELGKEIKYEACRAFYLFFAMSTNVRFYLSYDIKHNVKSHCLRKKRYYVVNMYATLLWTSLRFPKIDKPLVIYRFYCMALFHSQTRRHMINIIIFIHVPLLNLQEIDIYVHI